MKDYYIDASGARLKVFEYGSGDKSVILLHGGPCMPDASRSLGNVLRDSFHVVEYYQRGVIESPSDGPYRLENNIADLHTLIESLHLDESPILAGHSYGAILALAYAATYPDNCSKAILLGTGPLDQSSWDYWQERFISRLSNDDDRQKYIDGCKQVKNATSCEEAARLRLNTISSIPETSWTQEPESLKKLYADISPPSANPIALHLMAADWEEKVGNGYICSILSDIRIPVVAFHGDYDLVPHDIVLALMEKHLTDFKSYIIPDGGHFFWNETKAGRNHIDILKEEISH